MMKVKDLIKHLLDFNPDADVGVRTLDDEYVDHIYVSYVCNVNGEEINEKETKQVWLEAVDMCVNCQFFEDNYCNAYDCNASNVKECHQFIESD